MAGAMNMRHRREARRKAAEEMAQARATRTPKQQLVLLDERLGKGVGAARERAQLKKQLTEK